MIQFLYILRFMISKNRRSSSESSQGMTRNFPQQGYFNFDFELFSSPGWNRELWNLII